MAHKDNIKSSEAAAKALLAPEPEPVVEHVPTILELTGTPTGVIQLTPKYDAAV
jgi:hypothetical protein